MVAMKVCLAKCVGNVMQRKAGKGHGRYVNEMTSEQAKSKS